MGVITGRPPTGRQRLLIKAADSLAPDASLASLASLARLILGSVVLATSVLTGFGLFTDVAVRLRDQPTILAIPVGLAGLSAIAALLVFVPWPGRVKVDDLQSLDLLFTRLIFVRTGLVLVALVLLISSIGTAGAGVRQYLAEGGPSSPQVGLVRVSGPDGSQVTGTATQSRAAAGSTAELRITAGSGGVEVGRATVVVGAAGEVSLSATVPAVADAEALVLTYQLTSNGSVISSSTVSMEP